MQQHTNLNWISHTQRTKQQFWIEQLRHHASCGSCFVASGRHTRSPILTVERARDELFARIHCDERQHKFRATSLHRLINLLRNHGLLKKRIVEIVLLFYLFFAQFLSPSLHLLTSNNWTAPLHVNETKTNERAKKNSYQRSIVHARSALRCFVFETVKLWQWSRCERSGVRVNAIANKNRRHTETYRSVEFILLFFGSVRAGTRQHLSSV